MYKCHQPLRTWYDGARPPPHSKSCSVLVRGSGHIGSAVAHALNKVGCEIIIHDQPMPSATRRLMSFSDALFNGSAMLEGVTCYRFDSFEELTSLQQRTKAIPITAMDFNQLLEALRPKVLVDARMRKREQPDDQRELAPISIGLGPNFYAGRNIDVAVETAWKDLGRLVEHGPTRDLEGEPRTLGGHGRDRCVYAPVAGPFTTSFNIGDMVTAGEPVASIRDTILRAPLTGHLMGLTHTGVTVATYTKVIEIDPRGLHARVTGIGERPLCIAQAVTRAILGVEIT